jgi:hypothetical protein
MKRSTRTGVAAALVGALALVAWQLGRPPPDSSAVSRPPPAEQRGVPVAVAEAMQRDVPL